MTVNNRTMLMVVLLALIAGLTVLVGLGIVQTTALRSPFRRVALTVSPSVVNIAADRFVRVRQTRNELDDLLQRDPQAKPSLRHQHTLGTGFIFSEDGYVLTNHHVISGYEEIAIHLADGTEFTRDSVEKIGSDAWSDLAVLRIRTKRKLPVARLGNSDRIEVGDWVAAVGNPFGLSGTLTAGIVSAFNRSGIPIAQGPQFQDFIQTDAAINPGNSGGPLVNDQGDVIGVNSAIRSPIRGSVGIGFAIPINFAQAVAAELIRSGRITRGFLGMDTQPIDDQIQAALGLKDRLGVLVSAVIDGGPASRAGVKPGDVVQTFNNQPIVDALEFQALAAASQPGSAVELGIRRWGDALRVRIAVAPRVSSEQPVITPPATRNWLGLTVRAALPTDLMRAGVRSGVVLDTIEPGGPADGAQLLSGDVLVEIDGRPVADPAAYRQLATLMAGARKPVLFRIIRNRQGAYFAVEP